jgi:signal transduction histidine kinase
MPGKFLSPQAFQSLLSQQPLHLPVETIEPILLPLFASIDRSLFDRLAKQYSCEPAEIICHEGEPADAAYLIWSGRVAIIKGGPEDPLLLGIRLPGEMVGEMALLENKPRSATIVALTPTYLLRINANEFQQLLFIQPEMARQVMSSISSRLRQSDAERTSGEQQNRQLSEQVQTLQTEKQQLINIQRVRQETSDLIIHDLRNPLNTIYLTLCMLELTLSPEIVNQNRQPIEIAKSAAERMKRLVNSLLDISRLESGEAPLHLCSTNLASLIQDMLRQLAFSAEIAQVQLITDIPDSLPTLNIDEDKIGRVIANLIDNALKFTPPQGTITIAVRATADELIISITDTGPGIPPEDRERIFERFAQSQQEKPQRGFGLGLTFCQLAVQAHNGKIWVEAGENGLGSRFIFTLPIQH